jgi:hypothetical protein
MSKFRHWGVFDSFSMGSVVHAVCEAMTACRMRFSGDELREQHPGETLARGGRLCKQCLRRLDLVEAPVRFELASAEGWPAPPPEPAPKPRPKRQATRPKRQVPPPREPEAPPPPPPPPPPPQKVLPPDFVRPRLAAPKPKRERPPPGPEGLVRKRMEWPK